MLFWQLGIVQHCLSVVKRVSSFMYCVLMTLNVNDEQGWSTQTIIPKLTFWMQPLNDVPICASFATSSKFLWPPINRSSNSVSCVKAPLAIPSTNSWLSTLRNPFRPVLENWMTCHSLSVMDFGLLWKELTRIVKRIDKSFPNNTGKYLDTTYDLKVFALVVFNQR